MTVADSTIEGVRQASRQLVRELGFMGGTFAGGDLPPSSVHALIEIEARPGITARDLGDRLRLEKSSVSRMLRKLVISGDIHEDTDADDQRVKRLRLTESGQERLKAIHAFARRQVSGALARLPPGEDRTVLAGLRLYAQALSGGPAPTGRDVHVETGYRPGLIARVTELHALYYAREAGFGRRFEAVVASGLAAFCERLDNPKNAIWTAIKDGEIVGAIAIDGEDLGPDIAHLRWFIVDDGLRGSGVGRTLLSTALAFVDAMPVSETHLWTFSGLAAARHLYESHGFRREDERVGSQWGKEVLEQRFVRRGPDFCPTEPA